MQGITMFSALEYYNLLHHTPNIVKERCELEILRSDISKYKSNVDVWGRNWMKIAVSQFPSQ